MLIVAGGTREPLQAWRSLVRITLKREVGHLDLRVGCLETLRSREQSPKNII